MFEIYISSSPFTFQTPNNELFNFFLSCLILELKIINFFDNLVNDHWL